MMSSLEECKPWCGDDNCLGCCGRVTRSHRYRLTTLEDAMRTVVERHGGVRAAERATGVDKSFISRLMNGHKVAPSAETLQALGLRAVPLYEVIK